MLKARYMAKNPLLSQEYNKHNKNNLEYIVHMTTKNMQAKSTINIRKIT